MDEKHTCICGGHEFTIQDAVIKCTDCDRIYSLIWLEDERFKKGEFILLEDAEDFNKRIRKEEGK